MYCSEAGAPSGLSPDMDAKDRQQALYNAVCEPILRRAFLLLQVAAAPIQVVPSISSPMKLLPGISIAKVYGKARSCSNLVSDIILTSMNANRFRNCFSK